MRERNNYEQGVGWVWAGQVVKSSWYEAEMTNAWQMQILSDQLVGLTEKYTRRHNNIWCDTQDFVKKL